MKCGQSRPDLFPEDKLERYFSIERYHLNGSRVLSRSFTVKKWEPNTAVTIDNEDEGDDVPDANEDSAMDIDPPTALETAQEEPTAQVELEDVDEDSDDDDGDSPADVAMVPMADMLNARFESENVYYRHAVVRLRRILLANSLSAGEAVLRGAGAEDDVHKTHQSWGTDCEFPTLQIILQLCAYRLTQTWGVSSGTRMATRQTQTSYGDTDTSTLFLSVRLCPGWATQKTWWRSAATLS